MLFRSLQKYVEDAEVSEIMVNGKDNIFIERRGKIEKTADKFDTRIGEFGDP